MTPDRARFNKEVEKGLLDQNVNIPIRAMTEQETAEQRIKIQADQIASLKRHIGRLETQLANELLVDDGSPLTPHGEAIAAGDGTLHGAIDYWQEQAFTMAAGQCCVKDGGLMADEHGHQYCDMERQRDELKAKLAAKPDVAGLVERWREGARIARSCDGDDGFYDATADALLSLSAQLQEKEAECEGLRADAACNRAALGFTFDAMVINSGNVGEIRDDWTLPMACQWNAWVRDLTAERENQPPRHPSDIDAAIDSARKESK